MNERRRDLRSGKQTDVVAYKVTGSGKGANRRWVWSGAAQERPLTRDGGSWLTAVQLLVLLEVLLEVEGLAAAGLRAGEGLLVNVLVLLVVLPFGGGKRTGVRIASPTKPSPRTCTWRKPRGIFRLQYSSP